MSNYASVNNDHELLDSIPPKSLDHDLRDEKKGKWKYLEPKDYDYEMEKESNNDEYSN